jgi:hypothetical protein
MTHELRKVGFRCTGCLVYNSEGEQREVMQKGVMKHGSPTEDGVEEQGNDEEAADREAGDTGAAACCGNKSAVTYTASF